jgi:mannan endo-1,4-beta-mannosidase
MSDPTQSKRLRFGGMTLIVAAALLTALAITYGVTRGSGSGVPEGFVYAEGSEFMLDGEPFYYAGANAYTLILETDVAVDMYLRTFAEEDLMVARAWAFYDSGDRASDPAEAAAPDAIHLQYWDHEAGAPAYNTSETGLQRLDYMIHSANLHGVKLVLPFVNNWTALGGTDQYVQWAGGEYHDDFYTDPQIKQWYKDWVQMLLERENTFSGVKYKDDPAIMAWELGNELRCSGELPASDACGTEMFVEWADEMSTFVKSIDPHHLIGFGGEGFLCTDPGGPSTLFNCEESGDPVALAALENIDMNGIHVYPNHWNPTDPTDDWEDWAVWWIEQHGQIATDANKPYFIGEYGWIDLGHRTAVYDRWLQTFYDAGGDGSHFWLMQPAVSIAAPADSVGFTQRCPGSACDLVGNWTRYLNEGKDWNMFEPIAVTDFTASTLDGTVTVDVLANDKIYGDATWDLGSLDLDPETAGVQTEFVTSRGTFSAVDGQIMFVSAPAESGTARVEYVVTDSRGNTSAPARLAVTRVDDATELDEALAEAEGAN